MIDGSFLASRPTTIREFPFKPQQHLFYSERRLQLHDGLPKYSDMPAELLGSGVELTETGQPLQ